MSSERKSSILIGVVITLVGICLAVMMLAYWGDYGFITDLFYLVLGIGITLAGVLWIKTELSLSDGKMEYINPELADVGEKRKKQGKLGTMLTTFRENMAAFFLTDGIKENAEIQGDTTQIYKNMLDLQKRRLDKMHVKMEFKSERRRYSNEPISQNKNFDGKYEIQEIEEQIEAKRKYSVKDKTILVRTNAETAHYTIINARQLSDDEVICPNCGSPSDRNNLMDGCDYCGTKFTLEDLGEKIAGFALRDNYEVAYEKHKQKRADHAFWFMIVSFILMFMFVALCFAILMFDEETSGASGAGNGSFLEPLVMMIGLVVVGGIAAFVLSMGAAFFYGTVVFPITEAIAGMRYHSKKLLSDFKKAEEASKGVEQTVKKFDPLFSIAGFYSNIQNKLAVLLFANDEKQINAFSLKDLSSLLPGFQNVIDYDVEEISLDKFETDSEVQKAYMHADVNLYEWNGTKIKSVKKRLGLLTVKDVQCKTQAVCAPFVMTCRGCGSSLSLAKGMQCEYCGAKLDLKKYDWAIADCKELKR